ncbi:MAG: TIGR03086 family protein [Streptosporangiales bacterium]|nr:TIGR03086 family protein [Streptosporangiales bacterium]
MTETGETARQTDGVGLLERAIGYAFPAVEAVTPECLACPTPCRSWDLRMLLHHVNDSLAALYEGMDTGRVGLGLAADDDGDPTTDPAQTFRERAARLLGAWTGVERHEPLIAIADLSLTKSIVTGAGAIEIAVHGWDISQACGHHRPLPYELAVDLLKICPLVVPDNARHSLFAAPITMSAFACPSDRLVAFLGRDPSAYGRCV